MKTNVHYYKFDLSDKVQADENKALTKKLKSEGLQCYRQQWPKDVSERSTVHLFWLFIQKLIKDSITLNTNVIYPHKWDINLVHPKPAHSEIFLMDWHEIIAGKHKEGYYLEITPDMQRIRDETLICSRCWTNYKVGHWCTNCIDSPNLQESELHLLFLRPVSTCDIELNKKSVFIPMWIKQAYKAAHPDTVQA